MKAVRCVQHKACNSQRSPTQNQDERWTTGRRRLRKKAICSLLVHSSTENCRILVLGRNELRRATPLAGMSVAAEFPRARFFFAASCLLQGLASLDCKEGQKTLLFKSPVLTHNCQLTLKGRDVPKDDRQGCRESGRPDVLHRASTHRKRMCVPSCVFPNLLNKGPRQKLKDLFFLRNNCVRYCGQAV